MTTDRVNLSFPADLDPDGLVTVRTGHDLHPLDDVPGVQHNDGVTAVALIDLARHIVAENDAHEAYADELSPPAPVPVTGSHDEATIRLAMIAAGYGDGFALNLDARRLPDYLANPDVSRLLAFLDTMRAHTR